MCWRCHYPEPTRRTLTHQPEPWQQYRHQVKSTPAYLLPTKNVPDRFLPYQKLYIKICQIHIPARFKPVNHHFLYPIIPIATFIPFHIYQKTSNFIKINIYSKILILQFLTILAFAVKNHIIGKNIYLKKRAFFKKIIIIWKSQNSPYWHFWRKSQKWRKS